MPTIDEYAHRPREERLTRIARTPSELAAAVRGAADAVLSVVFRFRGDGE